MDVNAVITSLCDADPVFGAPESLPEYHTEAKVYVPSESIVNLVNQMNDPLCLTQTNVPFLQGKFFKIYVYDESLNLYLIKHNFNLKLLLISQYNLLICVKILFFF